jgi:peptidoglycan/LPS O-acetylase OafA/YrhL
MDVPARQKNVIASGWHDLTTRPPSQEPALDALRAIAVLIVICTHYALPEWPEAGGQPVWLTKLPVFYYGWTGVDLFFVLSGLLIGRQVWREVQKTGTVSVPRFLIRRGFRIWPLYFVALGYLAIVSSTSWQDWVFLSNYAQTKYPRGWSLSTEEQFYIIVPLLLLVTTRFLSLRRQIWPLLALLAAVPVVRYFTRQHLLTLDLSSETFASRMHFPIHLHSEPLLIGLIIALLSTTRPEWFEKRPPGQVAWASLGIFAALAATGIALDLFNKDIFAFLALGLIFGGATYVGLVDRSLLTRPLHAKLFYPISRLSFGMYLNHFIVVPGSTLWVVSQFGSLPAPLVFTLGLLVGTSISIVAATITFLLVEHPFLLLRSRALATRAVPAGVPTSADVGVSLPQGATDAIFTDRAPRSAERL